MDGSTFEIIRWLDIEVVVSNFLEHRGGQKTQIAKQRLAMNAAALQLEQAAEQTRFAHAPKLREHLLIFRCQSSADLFESLQVDVIPGLENGR